MQKHTPTVKELPDKLYFKIGEVVKITGIPAYVLRFWETQFPRINPKRTPSGQRQYSKSDLELILKIKDLLYEKKFTIQGAKRHLNALSPKIESDSLTDTLKEIRMELEGIRDLLG